MSLRTEHLARCLQTLETSLAQLRQAPADSIDYEVYRNATVKGFELALETTGKLLRKALKTYTGNPRAVDELTFKDVFRHAAKHGLLDTTATERWFVYRDNRNNTAHDYGVGFAEETLALLPGFLTDARQLEEKPSAALAARDAATVFRRNLAMPKLDLQPQYRQMLLDVLAEYAPDGEVWAYGSRVNGQAHDGSDLDLVVRNPDRLDAPQKRLHLLRDALTESDLPILVEVLDWARLPEDMRHEIERQHVVIAMPIPANAVAEARAKYGK